MCDECGGDTCRERGDYCNSSGGGTVRYMTIVVVVVVVMVMALERWNYNDNGGDRQ